MAIILGGAIGVAFVIACLLFCYEFEEETWWYVLNIIVWNGWFLILQHHFPTQIIDNRTIGGGVNQKRQFPHFFQSLHNLSILSPKMSMLLSLSVLLEAWLHFPFPLCFPGIMFPALVT